MERTSEPESATATAKDPSLLPVVGLLIVLAAVLERCLSVFNGPETYVLCPHVPLLSERRAHEAATNRWLLLAGLVLAVAALVLSRVRRQRVVPVLLLPVILLSVVLADGYAARADAVAHKIWTTQGCDEPTALYETSRGWFDWSPLS
ncbi:hypothetical protein ACFW9D_27365 [Streptomyces sp. NPDC059524]|uniref:hypothetical protein n=1 Tax=Streptomyces sp. NPDC059524 TaxID=3346856 RepID=UPI0036907900